MLKGEKLEAWYEERARGLGHNGLAEILDATKDLTGSGLGAMLGVSTKAAQGLRRRHGMRSPGSRAVNLKRRVRQKAVPVRTPLGLRPVAPLGVQPEDDDGLQCLDCGKWFVALGIHVQAIHGITADDYRREYELPASIGLVTTQLRERFAARARRRFATDERLREALRQDPAARARALKLARAARIESEGREGVQSKWRQSAQTSRDNRSRRIDAADDKRAQELAYSDTRALVEATTQLTAAQLAELLGTTQSRAKKLRVRFGVRSVSKHFAAAERRKARENDGMDELRRTK